MKRYLYDQILKDLGKKMVFVSGPRQCGKTTLAKELLKKKGGTYWNWDYDLDRENILRQVLPSKSQLLVFDEIHKYARWRNYLKGIYDKHKEKYEFLITGSAKLDHYRKGGDSLQGRYHHLRLHPLTYNEVKKTEFQLLYELGPFPEPFFSGSKDESRRWSREYRSRLIREDIASLEHVSELSLLENLAIRLPECVGSGLSINSLREDLRLAHSTVARWIDILESVYAVYRIYPFGSPKIRAIKKEAKLYMFDWNLVENEGARFENMVANHLLKYCHFIEDTEGYDMELRYFKDNEKREVDFVMLKNRKPIYFIECKLSEKKASTPLLYLKKKFPEVETILLTFKNQDDFIDKNGVRLCAASRFLSELI